VLGTANPEDTARGGENGLEGADTVVNGLCARCAALAA
jgi:hypothetical protein